MSYYKDLEINQHKLDQEILQQPQLYMKWATRASEATDDKEIAKDKLEILKNRFEKKIRKNPAKYDITDRVTEGAIKTVILNSLEIRRATTKIINLTSIERTLNEAKNAFKQRQRMLESLVKLKTDLWYSDVKTTEGYKEKERSDIKRRISKSLNRTKR